MRRTLRCRGEQGASGRERTTVNDYVVRFECRLFQILKTGTVLPRTGDKVTVRVRLEGSIHILWKGKPLLFEEIPIPNKGRTDPRAA